MKDLADESALRLRYYRFLAYQHRLVNALLRQLLFCDRIKAHSPYLML